MSAKAKPTARREVFGRNVAPPKPVAPAATIKAPPGALTTAKNEPTATEAPVLASERYEPTNEPVVVVVANVELVPTSDEPMPIVAPVVRRGHLRAKVLVHGLNCTGYALGGEYRTQWRKGDEGEFLKSSIDGIYLEAL